MPVAKGISKKRNAGLILFLIFVTFVVLYSYCNGRSVCFTMPLFTDWSRVAVTETKHGLVLTSSVVLETEKSGKHKNVQVQKNVAPQEQSKTTFIEEDKSVKISSDDNHDDEMDFSNDFSGLSGSGLPVVVSEASGEGSFLPTVRPIRPPSDITGEVANRILKEANISSGEADRRLLRVKRPLNKPIDITGNVAERILRRAHVSREEAEKGLVRVKRIGQEKIHTGDSETKKNNGDLQYAKSEVLPEINKTGKAVLSIKNRKVTNLVILKSSADKELLRVKRLGDEDENEDEEPGKEPELSSVRHSQPSAGSSLSQDMNKEHNGAASVPSVNHTPMKKFVRQKNGEYKLQPVKYRLENPSRFPYNKTFPEHWLMVHNESDVTESHNLRETLQKSVNSSRTKPNFSVESKLKPQQSEKSLQKGDMANRRGASKEEAIVERQSSSSNTLSVHPLGQLLSSLESLKEHIKGGTDNAPITGSAPTADSPIKGNASTTADNAPTTGNTTITDNTPIYPLNMAVNVSKGRRPPFRTNKSITVASNHTQRQLANNTRISNTTHSLFGSEPAKNFKSLGQNIKNISSGLTKLRTHINSSHVALHSKPSQGSQVTLPNSNIQTSSPRVLVVRPNNNDASQIKEDKSVTSLERTLHRKGILALSNIRLASIIEKRSESSDGNPLEDVTTWARFQGEAGEESGSAIRSGSGSGTELVRGEDMRSSSGTDTESVRGEDMRSSSGTESVRGEDMRSSSSTESVRGENMRSSNGTESVRGEEMRSSSSTESVQGEETRSSSGTESVRGEETRSSSGTESVRGEEMRSSIGNGSDNKDGELDDAKDKVVHPTVGAPLKPPRPTNRAWRTNTSDIRQGLTKTLRNGLLKYDELSCEPLDPKVLLFNRIFKTGSSTTEFFIKKASSPLRYSYHLGTTEDWYDRSKRRLYPGLIVRKAAQKLKKKTPRMAFVAHFYFRKKIKIQQAHTYINQVREPIRRVISHYYYMRSSKRPRHRIKRFFKSKEFNETLEECFIKQHKGCESNVMTRFFCGVHSFCKTGSAKALERAIYNIKHFYGVVGLLEQYGAYIHMLHKRFPNFFPAIKSPNSARIKSNPNYNANDVSDDLKQMLIKANWADIKLYEFIEQNFRKQARACGIPLAKHGNELTR